MSEFSSAELSIEMKNYISLSGMLKLIAYSGFSLNASTGELCGTDNDPWLEFDISESCGEEIFAELRFQVNKTNDSSLCNARIYFDYGDGWSENNSIGFDLDYHVNKAIIVSFPHKLRAVRFDPDDKLNSFGVISIHYRPLPRRQDLAQVVYDSVHGRSDERDRVTSAVVVFDTFASEDVQLNADPFSLNKFLANECMQLRAGASAQYSRWISLYASPSDEEYDAMQQLTELMIFKPKFSFIVPIYNTDQDLLLKCIHSMLSQNYKNFEICIADDSPLNMETKALVQELMVQHECIKFFARTQNGHISAASNSALELADGDYIVLVDHDDEVPKFALFVVAYYINKYPDCKVLFSDEDKIDLVGKRSDPYFKSDFDPFLMFGHNMVSHLGVYERKLIEEIGGFREGLEGSQDYDLFLRCYEKIQRHQVVHIPHILYHWRMIPGSTAVSADQKSYAMDAAVNALNGYFERNEIPFRSTPGVAPGLAAVKEVKRYNEKISIIIPTKDNVADLSECVSSILELSSGQYEILVISNRSEKSETIDYLNKLKNDDVIKVINYDKEFNYSAINNFAVRYCSGEVICFLNDDTVVKSKNWLNRARCLLSMPEIGAVGSRLLFEDDTVQHFGIWTGVGAHSIAATPHRGVSASSFGYFGKARLIQEFNAATAACLFTKKGIFQKVGGFEEQLAVAYNDIDLCLKIRSLNLRIVCDPEITLIHKESKTRGADDNPVKAERLVGEADFMRNRWKDVLFQDPYRSPNISDKSDDFALAFPPRAKFPWQI